MPQIKVLNNLLLAIYSRIFVGCFFAYALNKSINLSKVFCSSLRYSIYKVQSLFALAVSFDILAHLFQFVKNFFQVFSNFFSRLNFVRCRDSWVILSQVTPFVKNFFLFFEKFFSFLRGYFLVRRCSRTACIY